MHAATLYNSKSSLLLQYNIHNIVLTLLTFHQKFVACLILQICTDSYRTYLCTCIIIIFKVDGDLEQSHT